MSEHPKQTTLAVLLLSVVLAGCGLWLDDETRLDRAQTALDNGEYSAAIIDLKAVLQNAPDNGMARKLLGLALVADGEPEMAERELQRALDLGEPIDEFRVAFVEALLSTGQPDQALQFAEPAAASDMRQAFQLWLLRGDAQAELGETAEALRSYQQAENLNIEPGATLLRAAELYWGAGNLSDAQTFADAAIAADPELLDAHLTLAAIFLETDNPDAAVTICGDAQTELQLEPVDRGYLIACLAEAYLAKGDLAVADDMLIKLRALWPAEDSDLQLLSAQLALAEGKNDVAAVQLQAYLAGFPDSEPAARMLGAAELARGNVHMAKARLVSARASDPDNVDTLILLSRLYLRQGELDSAGRVLESALTLAPEHPAVLSLLGVLDLKRELPVATEIPTVAQQLIRGQVTQALTSAETKMRAGEKTPEALNMLGLAELANGRTAAAVATFTKAVELNPGSPEHKSNLARAHLANAEPEAGLKVLNDIATANSDATRRGLLISLYESNSEAAPGLLAAWLTAHPDDTDARLRLAEAYLEIDAFESAAAEYELLLDKGLDEADAYNNLAWAYLQLEDQRARSQAEYAVYVEPSSGAFADTLGWILLSEGETAEGLTVLRDAHILRPGDPEITYHLAYALAEAGEADEARALLDGLLEAATGPLQQSAAALRESMDAG